MDSRSPATDAADRTLLNQRTIEVYNQGEWEKGSWAGLKEGHIFRMREPAGGLADQGTNHEISIAIADSTPQPAPMYYCVESEPFVQVDRDHKVAPRLKVYRDGVQLGRFMKIDMLAGTVERKGATEPFDYVTVGPKLA